MCGSSRLLALFEFKTHDTSRKLRHPGDILIIVFLLRIELDRLFKGPDHVFCVIGVLSCHLASGLMRYSTPGEIFRIPQAFGDYAILGADIEFIE